MRPNDELTPGLEQRIDGWLSQRLSAPRHRHSLGVAEAVTGLAAAHGEDPAPLRLAALLHDSAREIEHGRAIGLAREWGLKVRPFDEEYPVLLHGPLAAELAVREFGITDNVILDAVRYHTAGHPKMSLGDKLVFLADIVEPGRSHYRVRDLRALAYEDADRAMLMAIDLGGLYLRARGKETDPRTCRLWEKLRGSTPA